MFICGFDKSAKDLGITNTNLWIYPSYDHDINTEKYMNDETNEFPLAYFSFASSKDPDWEKNYPDTATMEVIVPTNFSNYAKWEDGNGKKRQ